MPDWPEDVIEYKKAVKSSALFCRIVEAISTDPFLQQLRAEQDTTTQVVLLVNGDVIVRHNGSHHAPELMPNWPYHVDNSVHIVIAGDCSGSAIQ